MDTTSFSKIDLPPHILSSDPITKDQFEQLYNRASFFKEQLKTREGRNEVAQLRKGRLLHNVFYEPSTRTRMSFGSAAHHLGMHVVTTENAKEFSSAVKGETIQDSIRIFSQYVADCIVLRHFETGSVQKASTYVDTPVINAGDGRGEHPTQALLDLMTAKESFPTLSNLQVVVGGDLANGRTAKSFAKLLSKWDNNHFVFITTAGLEMPDDVKKVVADNGCTYSEKTDEELDLSGIDVVYWTRIQKERLQVEQNYEQLKARYQINSKSMSKLPESSIILHPLPRDGEIAEEVDADPRAKYFEQAGNGLYIRMALLESLTD